MSCEQCYNEARRRGIMYADMLATAERDEYPCTAMTEAGAMLRAGEYWDSQRKCDKRMAHVCRHGEPPNIPPSRPL